MAWGRNMCRTVGITKKNSLTLVGFSSCSSFFSVFPKSCGYLDPLSTEVKMYT